MIWEWRRRPTEPYLNDDFIEVDVEDGRVCVALGEDDYEVSGSVALDPETAREFAARLVEAAAALDGGDA